MYIILDFCKSSIAAMKELCRAPVYHRQRLQLFLRSYTVCSRGDLPISLPKDKIQTVTNRIADVDLVYPDEASTTAAEDGAQATSDQLHLHLKFVTSGSRLQDGITGLKPNCVVAVTPHGKNWNPWFARVEDIQGEHLSVRWMHKSTTNNRY